jgi:hypothetical protein
VASQKSKRKRRNPSAAPRAVPSQRREQRVERQVRTERQQRTQSRTLGTTGERPPSPFGGLPVSEVAIFAGMVGFVVGLISGNTAALLVGVLVCGAGVFEFTAREHLTGYRSHTSLLAGLPAVLVEVAWVAAFGVPKVRVLLLLLPAAVFAALFFPLRRRFTTARQARMARPPRA